MVAFADIELPILSPENRHITVRFLGEADPAAVSAAPNGARYEALDTWSVDAD